MSAAAPNPGRSRAVRELMTTDVVTARAATPLIRVIDDMVRHGVSGLPVIDDRRHVVGIITEADVIARRGFSPIPHEPSSMLDDLTRAQRNIWRRKVDGCTVGDVMSAPADVVTADTPLSVATARMVTMSHRRLPVVDDDGRLVGVISRRDVLRLLHADDDETAVAVRRALADASRCPPDHDVTTSTANGAVTLHGSARDRADIARIVAVLRDVPGVLEVHDALVEVRSTRGPLDGCDDA